MSQEASRYPQDGLAIDRPQRPTCREHDPAWGRKGHKDAVTALKRADPLLSWLLNHKLSEELHLPVLTALGVNSLSDLVALRGLTLSDLFADISWSLSISSLPTSLPCAPLCTTVKAALHKAINAGAKDEL